MRLRFRFWAAVFDASLRFGWDRLNSRAIEGMSNATDWGECSPDAPGVEVPF